MENTKLPLPMWFAIIEEFASKQNALEISKKLNVNYRTVWLICHKLRNAFGFLNDVKIDGEVEADEIIYGSKRDQDLIMSYRISSFNKAEAKKEMEDESYKAKAYGNQRVLLNVVGRNGQQVLKLIGASKADMTTENLKRTLIAHVPVDAKLFMDSHPTHLGLKEIFEELKFVTHTLKIPILDENGVHLLTANNKKRYKYRKSFKEKDGTHTNSVESSNSRLNRFLGNFIKHSFKYAQLYYHEYVFHSFCSEMNFLEKMRQILWNSQSSYITLRELTARENEYPEHTWKKNRKKFGGGHSRKKKETNVNFKFS
jgi:hypothetical protein